MVTAGLTRAGRPRVFSYVSGLGWGWVTILGTPGRSGPGPRPPPLASGLTGIAHLLHVGRRVGRVLSVTRFFGLLVAACRRASGCCSKSDRIGTLKALGITLLLLVVLGPVVQPWYLSWGLILLAPVALGRLRSLIVGLSMVTAFIELPGATQLVHSLIHSAIPLQIVLTLLRGHPVRAHGAPGELGTAACHVRQRRGLGTAAGAAPVSVAS